MKQVFLLFFFAFCLGPAVHAQTRTSFQMNETALTNFVSQRFDYLKVSVGRLAGWEINAYADYNLRKVLTKEDATYPAALCETISIPDPMEPDNPYKSIDTAVCTPLDHSDVSAWVLRQGKTFKSNSWKDVKAVGMIYNPDMEWDTLANEVSGGKDSFLYYIRKSDFERTLLPEETRLLQAYLDFVDPVGNKMDSVIINYPLLKTFILGWCDSFSAPLYRKVVAGSIPAYWRDSLNRVVTVEDLERMSGECAVLHVPNRDNMSDPYDMIDTVVCRVFVPDELTGVSAGHVWHINQGESRASLKGIGFLFQQSIGGVELPDRPMFWLKSEDVKENVSSKDWAFLTDMLNFQMLWSVEKYYYWRW